MNLHLPVAALAVAAVAGGARAQEPEVRVLEIEPQIELEEMVVEGDEDGDAQVLYMLGPDGRVQVVRGGEGDGKGKAKGRKGGGEGDLKADILREVDRRIERHIDRLRAEIREMLGHGAGHGPGMRADRPDRGAPDRARGDRHEFRIETHGEARDGHGRGRIRIEHDGKVIEKELPFVMGRGGPQTFDLPGGGKMQFHFEGGPGGPDGPRMRFEGKGGPREFHFDIPEGIPDEARRHFYNYAQRFRMGPPGHGEGREEGEDEEGEGRHEGGPRSQHRAYFQVEPRELGGQARAWAQRAIEGARKAGRLGKHGDVEVEVLGDRLREAGPEIRKALGKLKEHLGEGDLRDVERSIREALKGLEGAEGDFARFLRVRPGHGPDRGQDEEREERGRREKPRREHDF